MQGLPQRLLSAFGTGPLASGAANTGPPPSVSLHDPEPPAFHFRFVKSPETSTPAGATATAQHLTRRTRSSPRGCISGPVGAQTPDKLSTGHSANPAGLCRSPQLLRQPRSHGITPWGRSGALPPGSRESWHRRTDVLTAEPHQPSHEWTMDKQMAGVGTTTLLRHHRPHHACQPGCGGLLWASWLPQPGWQREPAQAPVRNTAGCSGLRLHPCRLLGDATREYHGALLSPRVLCISESSRSAQTLKPLAC